MLIGLLMVNHEDDILADTLAHNQKHIDTFYTLDGTQPNRTSRHVCQTHIKCAGYYTDSQLPDHYPSTLTDGYRQFIYEKAVADHGPDHWFLILHADELWTFDPQTIIAQHPDADGFIFNLPAYIPREPWNHQRAIRQLKWWIGPGYPEFRMFHGNPDVAYDIRQNFNTQPAGLKHVVRTDGRINHYPWRSPAVQHERAAIAWAGKAGQPTYAAHNYGHVTNHNNVIWTDQMIADYIDGEHYLYLGCDA
jgi:hypothetical protein